MKISGQGHAAIRDFEARCAIKAAEQRKGWKADFDAKEHCRVSETEEEIGVDTSLCKKEFEEVVEVAGYEIEGIDLEGRRAGKRLKTVVKIPEHVAGIQISSCKPTMISNCHVCREGIRHSSVFILLFPGL